MTIDHPMTKGVLLVMAMLLAAGAAAAGSELTTVPVTVGQQVTFTSKVLGEERSLLVATPTGYEDGDDPHPVLYVLDGRSQFLHTVASADLLARTGHIPPLIVVGITNVDRTRDFTMVDREGQAPPARAGRFLEFLEGEVVPLVERSFRAAPYRILTGHSLGSLLAVHAMIERPRLFQAYLCISPAITADERDLPRGTKPVTARLAAALAAEPELRRDLFITMSGGEDPRWDEDLSTLVEVLETAAPPAFDWEVERLPEEDHGTTVVRSTFDGLRRLFLGWDGSGLLATGSLDTVLGHYRALSQRLGYEVDPPENLLNQLGYRFLADGDFDRAVAVFEVNAKLRPDSPNVYDSLGEALERRGAFPGALKNYRIACRLAEEAGHSALAVYERNRQRVEQRLAERAR